jgi:hypothetical protein
LKLKVLFFRPDHTLVDTESVIIYDSVEAWDTKSFEKTFYAQGVPSEFTWSRAIEEATFLKDGHVY